uniref:Uncharacterized protein n=1 Tax=Glycine max TaxID=3847 RepID=K7LCL0_SOYBN
MIHEVVIETPHASRFEHQTSKNVFLQVVEALINHHEYFQMKVDATRRKGLPLLQKCTIAPHIFTSGSFADSVDEYIWIVESTIIKCLQIFVLAVCKIFGDEYLRSPNNEDIERLLQMRVPCGFTGMLGFIDCNDMSTFEVSSCAHPSFISKYIQRRVDVHDNRKPYQFQADLIGHIWECFKK